MHHNNLQLFIGQGISPFSNKTVIHLILTISVIKINKFWYFLQEKKVIIFFVKIGVKKEIFLAGFQKFIALTLRLRIFAKGL